MGRDSDRGCLYMHRLNTRGDDEGEACVIFQLEIYMPVMPRCVKCFVLGKRSEST
jgi:hypothetical protein